MSWLSMILIASLFVGIILLVKFTIFRTSEEKVNAYPLTKEAVMSVDEKKLTEIRNRENIKRQQELIVQEVYLTEEKDRINNEKEEAIKQFDAEIQKIEEQLEATRKEKISF